jgi:hypothetical protein
LKSLAISRFISLFLNDIDTFLENKNITGLQTISNEIENNLDIYLKLVMLLYADDTALLAKTSYIAFSALSARCFFVKLKFPVLVKIIPR